MRYSKLFGKTIKDNPSDAKLASHRLLLKAGFIRESTAGRYYLLPLGIRVHDKIRKIVKEEMDMAGAQELITPVLHPLELWEETNRVDASNFELTTVEDRRGAKFALGGTAEEMIVDLVRKFQISYKDLPFNVYQFSSKFRDELRARGGLLRVREFIMKDGYSFHATNEDFEKEYKNMWKAYDNVFKRLAIPAYPVAADNGYFGGDYCHEFVVESEVGESTYFVSEDETYIAHEDIAKFKRDEVNMDEEVKEFEIFEQPEWVKTMEDNMKFYNLPKSRFLKNVVYKNRVSEEIIIATIRGDLEVNKNKLEHVLDAVGLLDDATDEDLAKIGTRTGYVHSWGHKGAKYVGDLSLKTVRNFIGGQKEEKIDSRNVNYGRDFEHEITADIAKAYDGAMSEEGNSKLIEKKGVEVGNIFQLGQHYSSKMSGAVFTDDDGERKKYFMGCYGIGLGRSMATIVEKHNDEKGIIWPASVAPFDIHLISIGTEDEVSSIAENLHGELQERQIEVLWDDREGVRPGEKFADADLIGIPIRAVISKRSIENGGIEVKLRNEEESNIIPIDSLDSFVVQYKV
jgi:prolyl-tRNA synthetase